MTTSRYHVVKHQRLGSTDVYIANEHGHRIATVFDGAYDIGKVAALLAAAPALYQSCRNFAPLLNYIVEPLKTLLSQRGVAPDQATKVVDAVTSVFDVAASTITRIDNPPDPATNVAWSDPTYDELLNAVSDIRRTVGSGYTDEQIAQAEHKGGDVDVMQDINVVAAILNTLRPKALRETTDAE